MAVQLNIDLSDDEQAKLEAVALMVNPSLTPSQIRTWAERQAKNGLKEAVKAVKRNIHVTEMKSEISDIDTDWPDV